MLISGLSQTRFSTPRASTWIIVKHLQTPWRQKHPEFFFLVYQKAVSHKCSILMKLTPAVFPAVDHVIRLLFGEHQFTLNTCDTHWLCASCGDDDHQQTLQRTARPAIAHAPGCVILRALNRVVASSSYRPFTCCFSPKFRVWPFPHLGRGCNCSPPTSFPLDDVLAPDSFHFYLWLGKSGADVGEAPRLW